MSTCSENAGFLFKHACQEQGVFTCDMCQKTICEKHRKDLESQLVCVQCARGVAGRDYRSRSRSGRYWRNDDPYFYSYGYYNGYGRYGHGHWGHDHHSRHDHDRNDFTEADSESFQNEGDEGFEQDMGAS